VAVQGAEEVRYCYRHPDRETGLSCSECGRPICAECVHYAPVGLRCPEHSGKPQGVRKVSTGVRRASFANTTDALVTKTLIGINVFVYFMELATGGSLSGRGGGTIVEKGGLFVGNEFIGLAAGEWWRLVTAGFLHAGLIHLGFNMLLLWWFGSELERGLGRLRFLAIYFVSLLAGSAGAILITPQSLTVGASGAVFGLFGAAFVLERQAGITRGPAFTIIVLNLVLSFVIPGISIGGHIGGLVGGALSMLALTRLGRVHAVYGRPGLVGVLGVAAVGVASLVVAWLQVQSYT
jgi:membrane associated rhomboid family serine protease